MKAIHVDTESAGRPLVWAEADDHFIEVSCGDARQAAMLTVLDESGCAYKKEAWRIFNRMTGASNEPAPTAKTAS